MNDLRFAFRQLLKNPGFTAVAVLTLAVCIGANTAVFGLINAIILRPLPFKQPEQLVMVFERERDGSHKGSVSAPVFQGWREQGTVFEGLAARGFGGFILTGKDQPENVQGAFLSANAFSLLGLKPALGRDLSPEEETRGNHRVVMISHELWQRRFGGELNIIGRSITLNDEPFTIIGVMPPHTFFPEHGTQLWAPLAFSPEQLRVRVEWFGRVRPRRKTGSPRA